MASPAIRQAKRRQKLEGMGLVQIAGFVPASVASELKTAMKLLRENRNLEMGPLRDSATGRLVSVRARGE